MTNLDRFMSKVEKSDSGCWIWRGSYFRKQYGDRPQFWMNAKPHIAARAGWTLMRGPIPEGKMICHHCDNERCVNPDHLYVGDQATNMWDRNVRGRTNRWDKRYNFVQTQEVVDQIVKLRAEGMKISDICKTLDIGRTTFYRILGRGVIPADIHENASIVNYQKSARNR